MQETSALQTKEEVVPGRGKEKKLIPFLSAGRLELALGSADFPFLKGALVTCTMFPRLVGKRVHPRMTEPCRDLKGELHS